jgi:hypothetical protein
MKNKPLFLITSIALFTAAFELPYVYYQLLRFLVCGVGAYGAYLSYRQKKTAWTWILGITALIFNPFYKFQFGKEAWVAIDVIAGLIFLVYFIGPGPGIKSKSEEKK